MISSPYITTTLVSVVNLNARQMDNKIYKNLKENLIKNLENKCYRNYGFISKIYNVEQYTDGFIIAENPTASATFKLKFNCRLCNPLKNQNIVCKLMKILSKNAFINSQNGPITVISTATRINEEVFHKEPNTGKLWYKNSDGSNIEVKPGSYVVVNIESKSFNDKDDIIMALGTIIRLATEEEINNSFKDEYGVDQMNNVIDFDEYIKSENVEQTEN